MPPTPGKSADVIASDEVRQVLECPVCLETPRKPPLFICPNGHGLCKMCKPQVSHCPVCRAKMGNTRNLALEALMDKLTKHCKYQPNGCKFQTKSLSNLEKHEQNCIQGELVSCPVVGCHDKFPMTTVLMHICSNHSTVKEEGLGFGCCKNYNINTTVKGKGYACPHFCLPGNKHTFLELIKSNEDEWLIWVYMLGRKEEIARYTFEIKLFNSQRKTPFLTFIGPCVHLKDSIEQMVKTKDCLVLSKCMAERFSKDTKIVVNVCIKKA